MIRRIEIIEDRYEQVELFEDRICDDGFEGRRVDYWINYSLILVPSFSGALMSLRSIGTIRNQPYLLCRIKLHTVYGIWKHNHRAYEIPSTCYGTRFLHRLVGTRFHPGWFTARSIYHGNTVTWVVCGRER